MIRDWPATSEDVLQSVLVLFVFSSPFLIRTQQTTENNYVKH